jgi:hypothetical protein
LWFIYLRNRSYLSSEPYLLVIYIEKTGSPLQDIHLNRLKRLIRKYEFLLEDWQEVEEISKRANQGMSSELHRHRPPEIKPTDFEVEESEEERAEEEPKDAPLKRLFRKVVVLCHPDKLSEELTALERERLIALYQGAVEAWEEGNWALMVVIAIKLGIELPPEAESRVEQIEQETQRLEQKIAGVTSSIPWQWYHAVEEEKIKLVETYLQLLGRLKAPRVQRMQGERLILGVGHPRTGTGYTAKLLSSWGLDVGHERLGRDGTVDWSLGAGEDSIWQDVDFRDWKWQHIIYCVRDPRQSLASIVGTEQIGPSVKFRSRFDATIASENRMAGAIASIIKWDEMIRELRPGVIYRIEDQADVLFKYLLDRGVSVTWSDEFVGQKWNQREHAEFEELLGQSGYVLGSWKRRINQYCDRYGYARLF